jgi:acetyl-CoA carboxylase biotin carboxylase subunit
MLRRILIANRGEIAVRIIRACREMGISSIAVYSSADESCLHASLADESICIGPPSMGESYLNIANIIAAAEICDAQAIHPGYGCLSENAKFASVCRECNIAFIGPSPEAIALSGDKAACRAKMQEAGVPVVPGSEGIVRDAGQALSIARGIGFPVLVKASAGGGGKGMRLAHNAITFSREFESARNEAEKAFGNGAVYVEKFVEEPRHIEIQVLADSQGHVVHLFERDCSLQRRYQKLVEEAPSPFLTPELRKRLGADAVKIAKACGYQNAGTIEFLVDKHGKHYFIEMNTRIQVEHGVTEEVTGIDLVNQQIRVASGERLQFDQRNIRLRGHAIECRINAEDPARNFAPCPGEVTLYYPPGGLGVRVDSHCYGGYHIPPHYDSMIGKLITTADNRNKAIERMYRALSEYLIRGVKTSIPLCRAIMQDPAFRSGHVTTAYMGDFLERNPARHFDAAPGA